MIAILLSCMPIVRESPLPFSFLRVLLQVDGGDPDIRGSRRTLHKKEKVMMNERWFAKDCYLFDQRILRYNFRSV